MRISYFQKKRLLIYKEEHDFKIVHCNATFSHFTGIISDKIVGESICSVINDIIYPTSGTGSDTVDTKRKTLVSIHKNRMNDDHPNAFVMETIPLIGMKDSSFMALQFQNLHYRDDAYHHTNQVVG